MADSSVAITAGSGTPIRVLTGLGTASADQQVVTLADSAGNLLGTTAAPLPILAPPTVVSGSITAIDAVVGTTSGGAIVSGTSTAGSYVAVACSGQETSWSAAITGGSGYVLWFEGSLDSTNGINGNWFAIFGRQPVGGTGGVTTNTTTGGLFRGSAADMSYVRIRALTSITGTVAVTLRIAAGVDSISLGAPLPAGTQSIGTVQQSSITKGTQGTTGVTTQDLKDAGRQTVVLSAAGVVSVTTVALMSLNQYVAGTVTTGVTTYTVPAGKTFRIQSIQFGSRFTTPSTTVTFASTTFALRFVTTGTTVVGSPILHQDSKMSAANVPTPNSDMAIPDGLELPAGYNIGVTHLASAATLSEDVAIVGFLY